MGRFNATLYYRLTVFLLFVSSFASADPVTGTIKGVKFPEYDDSGKLEYMLYSEIANPRGVVIDMQGVLVDFVKKDVSVSKVEDNRTVELYSVKESSLDSHKVDAFWKRYSKSKGFCRTPRAKYDRVTKLIRGDELVHFRTVQMDIDGVGFDMDQEKGTLHIRSKVHVVIRDNEDSQDKI